VGLRCLRLDDTGRYAMTTDDRIAKYEAELQRLNVSFRWGETRRFHSNTKKIARCNWLISKLATLRTGQESRTK
jgi:hypothetical protein